MINTFVLVGKKKEKNKNKKQLWWTILYFFKYKCAIFRAYY